MNAIVIPKVNIERHLLPIEVVPAGDSVRLVLCPTHRLLRKGRRKGCAKLAKKRSFLPASYQFYPLCRDLPFCPPLWQAL